MAPLTGQSNAARGSPDVLAHFEANGNGTQTRIDAAL
ncbi:BrnA antitoxin family protein [Limnohabitans sp. 2KL-17]